MLTIKFSAHTSNNVDNCDCRASRRRREQRAVSKKKSSELRTYFLYKTFLHIEWNNLTKAENNCVNISQSRERD